MIRTSPGQEAYRGALHERYRGHRPVGGVGLALVHGLVTRMGGTIAAQRAPEGGACFTVTLAHPGCSHADLVAFSGP